MVTLTVDVPEPLTEVGLKLALAPAGKPIAEKATLPLNPFRAVTVAVYEVPAPTVTVCEAGEADIEKSGAGFTVRVTFAV